jgi:hypothetical protein
MKILTAFLLTFINIGSFVHTASSDRAIPETWLIQAQGLCTNFKENHIVKDGLDATNLLLKNGKPDTAEDSTLAIELYKTAQAGLQEITPLLKNDIDGLMKFLEKKLQEIIKLLSTSSFQNALPAR